jgi:hypothetical protein
MAIMAITAATPKIIPSAVSIDRSLFEKTASSEMVNICKYLSISICS